MQLFTSETTFYRDSTRSNIFFAVCADGTFLLELTGFSDDRCAVLSVCPTEIRPDGEPIDLPHHLFAEKDVSTLSLRFSDGVQSLTRAQWARSLVSPGRYRHFKGNEYEVLDVALHSETVEPMVVYRALYGDGALWVRPVSMWNETVTRDGKTFRRFTLISPAAGRLHPLSESETKTI